MCKSVPALLLALCFLFSALPLPAQSPLSLLDQLEANWTKQEALIAQLENSSEKQRAELEAALIELKESEAKLKRALSLSQNLGFLIEDQAIYTRSLERKLSSWRIATIVFGSLSAGLIAAMVITK
jgi:outer membrane PBP1 activator LpoA protein